MGYDESSAGIRAQAGGFFVASGTVSVRLNAVNSARTIHVSLVK